MMTEFNFSNYGPSNSPGYEWPNEWFTPIPEMQYQPPQLGTTSAMAATGGSPFIYRQAFGGYGVNAAPAADDKSWWANATGLEKLSAVGTGLQAFATLAQLYTGFKGLQQQKAQFKFLKSSWNKNFAAQLAAYDNQLRDNYEKYRAGNTYFGNPVQSEEDWMSSRSLAHLGS